MQNPAQSQVLKALKEANNVLVTVKNGPTVDELAAAIALTLMLNRMNKHAITVFSGRVPSMLEFLQPEMAIDTNTDSLRDFIIALDKSKADKLRYKVEDNVVRIFITPYKTSISEKDLEFSQGDFNVDVVVALGVVTKEDFDQAVTLHGRILHDATVIALTKQSTLSQIGAVNWQEQQASSVSEMIARLTDGLGEDVLDAQIATALMTGIVAETDRFRNNLTTPEVMTMSAKLMSAGANQQLIAEKLEAPETIPEAQPLSYGAEPEHDDGTLAIAHAPDEVQNIHIDDAGNLALPPEPAEPLPIQPQPQQHDAYQQQPAYQYGQMPVFTDPVAGPQPDFGMQPLPTQQDDQLSAGRSYMEPTQRPRMYAEDDSGQVAAQPLFETPGQPLNTALQASFPDQAAPLETRHKVIEPIPEGDAHGSYGKPFVPPVEPPVAIPTYTPPPEVPAMPAPQPAPAPAPVNTNEQPTVAPVPSPQAPLVDTHQTLADLEHAVGSTHAAPPVQASDSVDDFLGTTRTPAQEEVQQEAPAVAPPEVAQQEEETEEEKKEDENLIKIPDQTVPQPAPQVINPNAPPEVPPPLMPSPTQPQFFDADGNSANPFLNPN